MKILVASDLHGSLDWSNKMLEQVNQKKPDLIVLLGDLYYHGPRNPLPDGYNPKVLSEILNQFKDKLLVLKGNCDAEVDEMISEFKFHSSLSMNVSGKTVYFSHGHNFNIDNLPEGDFDIMFYGHFHTHFIKEKQGKLFVNPGSVSLPKGGTTNSYAVLTDNNVSIFDFDGNVIDSKDF